MRMYVVCERQVDANKIRENAGDCTLLEASNCPSSAVSLARSILVSHTNSYVLLVLSKNAATALQTTAQGISEALELVASTKRFHICTIEEFVPDMLRQRLTISEAIIMAQNIYVSAAKERTDIAEAEAKRTAGESHATQDDGHESAHNAPDVPEAALVFCRAFERLSSIDKGYVIGCLRSMDKSPGHEEAIARSIASVFTATVDTGG